MCVIVIDGHDAKRMGKATRAATMYGVLAAEYLLAAGALYGLVRFAATHPAHSCEDCWNGLVFGVALIWGEIALAIGLLAGLIILTVKLWRTRAQQQSPSSWRLMSVASQAAGWGLVCGASSVLVACFGGLGGLVV